MLLRQTNRRRGMTVVESALVLAVFFLLLFGAFEYCRFLYILHVANNAARDGARYAAVNLDKPDNFNTTDYTDASGNRFTNIHDYTLQRMGGSNNRIPGGLAVTINVFAVDPTALAQSPPVVQALSPGVWKGSFPNGIAVQIQGTYRPILPGLLFMSSSIPLNVTAISGSEG